MNAEARFLRESVVDIDAAAVGISSQRWTAISRDEASRDRAAQIMKSGRFDALPIVDSDGIVNEYFHTEKWNDYSTVISCPARVTHRDVVPHTTPIRDMIQKFALESKKFYFLSDERRIVGLISIANLGNYILA